MNAFFKDASRSPLKSKDLKTFDGLDFFKFDSTFIVKAKIDLTPEAKPIKMKTTTSRLAEYRQYGIVKFELDGKLHELSIYQDMDLLGTPEYESFLFLPFLDNTNGNSSYSGGRYVETTANEGEAITIDFNKSYNPYCAYNENYSCPIVPRSNYINAEIKAGVKNYKKP
jgi:uncharacterized protein (DUF1684 family)